MADRPSKFILENTDDIEINPATSDNQESIQVTEGGQTKQVTTNFTQEEYLEQILIKLDKISFHLSLMTDVDLDELNL